MSERDRWILAARIAGLSPREIAKAIGVDEQAVRAVIRRRWS